MAQKGINWFHFFNNPSGGICSQDKLWSLAGEENRIRSDVSNMTNADIMDYDSPNEATILFSQRRIKFAAEQINPWHGSSGVFIGDNNHEKIYGGISTSGLYIKPVTTANPNQYASHRWASIEGDTWQRKASSSYGIGRRNYNTGSGITNFAVCSGFFYGTITANMVIPASTGSWAYVKWAYSHTNDKCFSHSTAGGSNTVVSCMHDGWYDIDYYLTVFKLATASYSSALARCIVNGSVVLKGSNQMGAALLGTNGNSVSWGTTIHLKRGDTIGVQVREYATNDANIYLISDYGGLRIKYLGPGI